MEKWEKMLAQLRVNWGNALPYEKKEIEEEARLIKRNIELLKEWRTNNPRFIPKQQEISDNSAYVDEVEEIFK